MTSNRRSAILLAVFIAALGYYAWTLLSDGGSGSGAAVSGRSAGSRARQVASAEVEELATGRLEKKPGVYQHGRDLFSYRQAQRPRPRPQPKQSRPKPPPAEKPKPKPAVIEPPKPEPPPIDVSYLGSFGRPGHRIAVFADGEGVYNALVGDVIKDKFVLVAIGYESADLGFVGFPETSPSRLAAGRMR